VHVLAGEARLGTSLLGVGSDADWPLYAPLRLGATVLALGEEGSVAWEQDPGSTTGHDDVPSTTGAAGVSPASPSHASPPWPPASAAGVAPRRASGLEHRLALLGGALALAALVLLALGRLAAVPPLAAADPRPALARLLADQPGLQELQVDADASGTTVRGLLETNAQLERLRGLLARAGLGEARIDVTTGEQLVDAVGDVFRVQGVPARADYGGGGRVRVSAQASDDNLLQRAVATARRDVPRLSDLEVHNAPPVPPPQDRPVPDDPGKRVAALVPGASPYIATADGTRYFLGALLPTGDRIEAIDAHRVLLERDGRRSELDF
jgi:type III secretion protein D